MKDIYAILDIGSSTIKLLVGEVINNNITVLFSTIIPSHGVKKGIVEDVDVLASDIKEAIDEAEASLEAKISSVALSLPSLRAKLYQSDSNMKFSDKGEVITTDDVVRGLQLSARFERSKEEEIVSVIPVTYHTDRHTTYEAPIGKTTKELVVESMVVTTSKKILYPYMIAAEKAGLEILEISLNAYCNAKEAFDEVYLQEGALLIDIGYKTSTISFFKEGYLKYVTVCSVGGYDFTRRISQEFQISMNQAEIYKVKYGSLDDKLGEEDIIHTTYLQNDKRDYTLKELRDILQDTAYEMMKEIKEKVLIINDSSRYETIIVGGGGELEMLDKVATDVLGSPVRIYRPDTIGAREMAHVPSLGMIHYLIERSKITGKYEPSVILPDVSQTMSIRFKGLTKSNGEKTTSRINKLLDALLNEDE